MKAPAVGFLSWQPAWSSFLLAELEVAALYLAKGRFLPKMSFLIALAGN
jgi:hypothetical protein